VLKSLQSRNIALLIGIVLLGQLLSAVLLYALAIRPQADRLATMLAGNVAAISDAMDEFTPEQRVRMISRINAGGSIRILPGGMTPPEDRGLPTVLETMFMRSFVRKMADHDPVLWQGGRNGQLWVQATLGRERYWISYERPPGWTPNGALLASFLIAVSMALIAGLAIQRRLAEPLRQLAKAADATRQDDVSKPLARVGLREIDGLIDSHNAMRARLAEQEQRRTLMLAGISHDLRTPIAKIQLALAMERGVSPEGAALMGRQFERLDAMLGQFLDFARGVDDEPAQRLNIVALLQAVADDVGVPVTIDGPAAVDVVARPLAMQRVFANILRNAEVHGRPPVVVAIAAGLDQVSLAISDSGDRIDESVLTRLAEPFFRADGARGPNGGSGLGLAITSQLVAAQGGRIGFRRREPGGLIVDITLPRA
jgi:two-component system osmolarity sensor histidine kinase EnvZ